MKKLLFFAIIAMIMVSCANQTATKKAEKIITSEFIILVDNTDSTENRADMIDIGKIGFGKVMFSYITDVSMNKSEYVEYVAPEMEDNSMYNEMITDTAKEAYLKKLTETIKIFTAPTPAKSLSNIYREVKTSLEILKDSKATNKTLILMSDMVENSDCGNFYKPGKEPEVDARTVANCVGELPKNPGVEVIILFQAKNPKQDKQFKNSMKIWKVIFDHYGIPYKTAANM